MSYQVLARKWRPRRFEELMGQQHVLQALVNALDQNRLHHAYLFTGTRGVGKTTIARILAKSLNCETGLSSKPCGECSACREIDEGRFIDLIEVDAASRTKVDETRDLLENVHYTPTRGRYKVYLIDEVHMFSNHSFNALLKTLEEPPPHVKFLLATTDPKKLPVTILSRCLQFNLKRLTTAQIETQLEKILSAENIAADQTSRRLIAEAADGSLRDALSLLDQAIAFGNGALAETQVAEMLGAVDKRFLAEIFSALAAGDAAALLAASARMAEINSDFSAVLADMLGLLQRIAVVQFSALTETAAENTLPQQLATQFDAESIQLFYQIALLGRRDLPLAPDAHGGFDMLLLRMLAFQPQSAGTPVTAPRARSARVTARPASASAAPMLAAAVGADNGNWQSLMDELQLTGLTRQLAANCVFQGMQHNQFKLLLAPAQASLRNANSETRLQQAISARFGAEMRLLLSVGAADQITETPAQTRKREISAAETAARAQAEADPRIQMMLKHGFNITGVEITPPSNKSS